MEVLADAKNIFKNQFPEFQDNVVITFQKGAKKESKKNVIFLGEAMTYRETYEDYAAQIFDILIRACRAEHSVGNGKTKKNKESQNKKGLNWPWKEKRKTIAQEKASEEIKEQREESTGKKDIRDEMVDRYINLIYHDFSIQSKEDHSVTTL